MALATLFAAACTPLVDALLFMPSRLAPERLHTIAASLRLQPWTVHGAYAGLVAEPPAGQPVAGTVLVFHGNAGSAIDRHYYVAPLLARGMRVVLMEYPGYGARTGSASLVAVTAAAEHALAAVRNTWTGKVGVLGESLGAGIAARIATLQPVDGLILITPWASLAEVARQHFPWLPVSLLVPDPMDSIAALRDYRRPVAVLIAGRDEIISPDQGLRLARELRVRRLVHLENARHNDWLAQIRDTHWDVLASAMRSDDQ